MKQTSSTCCFHLQSDVQVAFCCNYMVCLVWLLGGKVVIEFFFVGLF